MADLTVMMLTCNLVPEAWAAYHKKKLLEATGDARIIVISQDPMNWPTDNLVQEGYGFTNIWRQMFRGVKLVRSEYVAMADDDTLYTKQHYAFRPEDNRFYYNLNRWHIFTWAKEPFYFHKPRPGNGLLICRTEMMLKALERRFEGLEGDLPGDLCHELGTVRAAREIDGEKWKEFYTKEPVLSFYHEDSFDEASQNRKKYAWPVRAYDIPVWGRAEKIREMWK